ncbi:hypothetical protein D9M68_586590 [compost metagenome]
MVGCVVLSAVCAAETPPASTTARKTLIKRISSSVTFPSMLPPIARYIDLALCEQLALAILRS